MELLKYFNVEEKDLVTFTLRDEEWENLVAILPLECKTCYITDEDLQFKIKNLPSTKEKELLDTLPDKGNIKSGDFGEILAYLFFKERHKDKNVYGPPKWRWKQNKNTPAPYTDVILFSNQYVDKPSREDLLISIESKMKATPNNSYNSIQAAIDGAEKDYISRLAKTLCWFRKKYKEDLLKGTVSIEEIKTNIKNIDRFINSVTTGEYEKKIKAIAFIDKDLYDEEIRQKYNRPSIVGLNLTVFALSIKNLKDLYEKVYKEILKL